MAPPPTAPAAPAPRPAPAVASNSPLGVWLTEEKEGKVRIEQCGANLCGYSVDKKTNQNGEQILINMKPAKDKWSGRIFDPSTGSTYDSTIAMKGTDIAARAGLRLRRRVLRRPDLDAGELAVPPDSYFCKAPPFRRGLLLRDGHHGRPVPGMTPFAPRNTNGGKATTMSAFHKAKLASLLIAGLVLATPAAASTFDGAWNVQIASPNSACTNGASVSIGISNGQVASNTSAVTASGRVAEAGTISVTLSTGIKRAVGSGRLSGTSGSGTWRAAMCSGTWTAQRN